MEHYIFLYWNDNDCLFRDIIEGQKGEIGYFPSHKQYHNRMLMAIERISMSYQINSRIDFKLKRVFYNISNYPYQPGESYTIIIPNNTIAKYDMCYLEQFKKTHPTVKLVALLVDSLHGHSIIMNIVRDKLQSSAWDQVLTYDLNDAKEFNYTWIEYCYYSDFTHVAPSKTKSDLYCISSPKGRDKMYAELYEYLSKKGIRCNFKIFTHAKEKCLPGSSLKYIHKTLPYEQCVADTRAANCILEVVQPDQMAQTIRYFEAVVFNKKLLTTNRNIVKLPYYRPEYMHIYDEVPESVDLEWLTRREEINYGYQGDFSPLNLTKYITT